MERMSDFFTTRVEGYDNHMLTNVEGCKQAYKEMARLVPKSCKLLLDLGCGTGLELDEIFKAIPNVKVIGIDLTQAMLDKLQDKYSDKEIVLICGNYFDVDFKTQTIDCAISFQTMHHFEHKDKIKLYSKIYSSLKNGGCYIECDYMVINQEEEDFYFAENSRIRKELNIPLDEFYHYDTPCTIKNQIEMLLHSGFSKVDMTFRVANTTIIVAEK